MHLTRIGTAIKSDLQLIDKYYGFIDKLSRVSR
jgi:hypothetical protein